MRGGETLPFFFIMKFYLDQLKEVENEPDEDLILSLSTVELCLAALIPAEDRANWVQDLAELDDTEWGEAVEFLKKAIEELSHVF